VLAVVVVVNRGPSRRRLRHALTFAATLAATMGATLLLLGLGLWLGRRNARVGRTAAGPSEPADHERERVVV